MGKNLYSFNCRIYKLVIELSYLILGAHDGWKLGNSSSKTFLVLSGFADKYVGWEWGIWNSDLTGILNLLIIEIVEFF